MKTDGKIRLIAIRYLELGATVRSVAKLLGFGKSTIHRVITKDLRLIDYSLYKECQTKINYNNSIKHIKGGQSTKEKYLREKEGK